MMDLMKEVERLSTSEKLQLVEDVWDSIARDKGLEVAAAVPDTVQAEIARRQAAYKKDPASAVPFGKYLAERSIRL
jgi:putative addiction module component (TIGR02574 family)